MMEKALKRVILSAGGTGGHIFPAVAVAREIKRRNPNCEILFVGAEGRMEMEKVPQSGFEIQGLPIAGLQRKLTLKNLLLPFKIWKSLKKAKSIIQSFKPQVVIGFGGYASGPTLRVAARLGIPTLLQEQNSYAGVTNKLLAKLAKRICVAYDGMDAFFPKEKIVHTGNPVRIEFVDLPYTKSEARKKLNLKEQQRTILVIGGSLGARAVNEAVEASLDLWEKEGFQIIWQCGKTYKEQLHLKYPDTEARLLLDFIQDMALVYAAADVVISRAGAMSVSELCLVGKPVVFMPSPNVAEDHQTKNAMALVSQGAAMLIKDAEGKVKLGNEVAALLKDNDAMEKLSRSIRNLAKPRATSEIVDLIEEAVYGD